MTLLAKALNYAGLAVFLVCIAPLALAVAVWVAVYRAWQWVIIRAEFDGDRDAYEKFKAGY